MAGGDKVGIGTEPEGGAKFIAGPEGSGTDAGGTGGGRSLNIWAAAGLATAVIKRLANASAASRHPVGPDRSIQPSAEIMDMLFTENAANSSLDRRKAGRQLTTCRSGVCPAVAIQS
jgi:hypothetical protein